MSLEQVLLFLAATIGLVLDHPWVLVPVAVAGLACITLASPAGGATDSRDPRRAFTAAERREAFERAGLRCEHKPLLWHRCTNTPTQGDHIYPWSKGGRTAMSTSRASVRFITPANPGRFRPACTSTGCSGADVATSPTALHPRSNGAPAPRTDPSAGLLLVGAL